MLYGFAQGWRFQYQSSPKDVFLLAPVPDELPASILIPPRPPPLGVPPRPPREPLGVKLDPPPIKLIVRGLTFISFII